MGLNNDTLSQSMACWLANPRESASMPRSFLLAADCFPCPEIPLVRVQPQGWADPASLARVGLSQWPRPSPVSKVQKGPTPCLRKCMLFHVPKTQWASSALGQRLSCPSLPWWPDLSLLREKPLGHCTRQNPLLLFSWPAAPGRPFCHLSCPRFLFCADRESLWVSEWVQIPCHVATFRTL